MKYSLPDSATDLLIKDGRLLMQSLSIYEILKRFGHIIRLTPFRFEDFCAALLAEEQSPLLVEVHIQLLKTLIREDRLQQTWLGPPDIRDSINIYLHSVDHTNWASTLKLYLSADPHENSSILTKLNEHNYPFNVDLTVKLDILDQLCDKFLLSNLAREEIVNGGNGVVKHDTTCRLCSKGGGDLVPCGSCAAIYHLKCSDPPLENYPDSSDRNETYLCAICRSNHIRGVSDCLDLDEKSGNLKRHESLGEDKLGRRYWFLVRRLFVVDDNEEDVRYYTTAQQLNEILDNLNENRFEKSLIANLTEKRSEIERQMQITEDLYKSQLSNHKNEDGSYSLTLGQEGSHKSYTNHYASSNLAKSKNQHSDRDITRSLNNKFSVNSLNSFKWFGAIDGHLTVLTITIKTTILKLETMIPSTFIHPCWNPQKSSWVKSINQSKEPKDIALALSLLESAIKPVLFKSAWQEAIGFSQLFRSTSLEREETKKTDRLQPRGFERREWYSQDFELSYKLGTVVKFSSKLKPVKHQVWKQKGEEYRLTGLNGWSWRSKGYRSAPRTSPNLLKTKPFRWLSPMNNHPFVVDMINAKIEQTDVINVAENLSCDEDKRILYPRKPTYGSQKRIGKLESLLKLKLDQLEKFKKNLAHAADNLKKPPGSESDTQKDRINGNLIPATPGSDLPKTPDNKIPTKNLILNGSNGDLSGTDISKRIVFYNAPMNTSSPNRTNSTATAINLLAVVNRGKQPQQLIKKCVFAQPKLPPCHDFMTKRSKVSSLLVLPELELKKLARSGGLKEAKSFNYAAKQSNQVWPYGMTPRPSFRTCWLYKNRHVTTIQDISLQLKVLYACIRWEDLQARPPASGHNVIVTDESTVTIELLKKRDRLPFLTHSEYLIKKVSTPIEQPTKYRKVGAKKATPSARSGLRARRQTIDEEVKGPTTEEVWVPEDQLELWELKQFDEKIERQNQLMRERVLREEAEKKRKLEEERRRKAEQERRQRVEEEARKARLAQAAAAAAAASSASATNTPLSAAQGAKAANSNIAQPRSLPTTPVLRYFRTEQGQIIRLPASYLERGTPLILRHVGPGPNQTNTYIIRPQITPVSTGATGNNLIRAPTTALVATTLATPIKPAGTLVPSPAASAPAQSQTPPTGTAPVAAAAPVKTLLTVATPSVASDPSASTTPVSFQLQQQQQQQRAKQELAPDCGPISQAAAEAASKPAVKREQPLNLGPCENTETVNAIDDGTKEALEAVVAAVAAAVESGGAAMAAKPELKTGAIVKETPIEQSASAQESVGTVVNEMAHDQRAPPT